MHYHFRVHEDGGGFWAECLELSGCVTQADVRNELKDNMLEALEIYLDEPAGMNVVHPLPDDTIDEKGVVEIPVPVEIALPLMLRHYRIARRMTQDEARKALGLKHRTEYARLEQRGNPTIKRVERIIRTFPDFPIEKCFSRSV